MATFLSGPFEIEINLDEAFSQNSTDNITQYEHSYFEDSEYLLPSYIGIRVKYNRVVVKSAIIAASGGGTGIHETSVIMEGDRLVLCCSDSIFCLSIPDLNLLWKTKADMVTCFEIFAYRDSYIVHGEMEISRLDNSGNILWQQEGGDIFTTLDGNGAFSLTDKYIIATDWNNTQYKFDYEGNSIS